MLGISIMLVHELSLYVVLILLKILDISHESNVRSQWLILRLCVTKSFIIDQYVTQKEGLRDFSFKMSFVGIPHWNRPVSSQEQVLSVIWCTGSR